YLRALRNAETTFGAEHPETATILHSLGIIYRKSGRLSEAERVLSRSVAIREKSLGPMSLDLAWGFAELAQVCTNLGKYHDAERLLKSALNIAAAAGESGVILSAAASNALGIVYYRIHDLGAAEIHLRRSLNAYEAARGPDHPDVALPL